MAILRPYGPSKNEQRRTAELFGSPGAERTLARILRRSEAPWASTDDGDAIRIGRAVACRCYAGPLKGPYTGLATPCSLVGFVSDIRAGMVAFMLVGNSPSGPGGRTRYLAPEDLSKGGTRQGCPTLVWHGMQIALPPDDEPTATWFLNGWLELLPPGQEYASINAATGYPSSR